MPNPAIGGIEVIGGAVRLAAGIARATFGLVASAFDTALRAERRRSRDHGSAGRGDEDLAAAFLSTLVGEVIERAVAQVDLDGVVARVDLDQAAARIDLNRAARRIDLDRIIDRIDLDKLVSRIDLDAVVDRIDLNALADHIDLDRIIDRIDVNRVAAEVDVNAVVDRVDLHTVVREVVEGDEVADLIRQSTGTVSQELVEGLRARGANADRVIDGIVDMILRRRRERNLATVLSEATADGAHPGIAPGDAR